MTESNQADNRQAWWTNPTALLLLAVLLAILALGLIYPIVYLVDNPLSQPWHALIVAFLLGLMGISSLAIGVVFGELQVARLRQAMKR